MTTLSPPIDVPWTMKPLESASTAMERLDDGRLRLAISHDLLRGVTPAMLVFWFRNLEGMMLVEGRPVARYLAWHPRDHVAFRYARRGRGGVIGPGARFAIHEVLGRVPADRVDVVSDVLQLDERGFHHRPRRFGFHPVDMRYRFHRVPGGTRYENELVVGIPGAPRWLNERVVARFFDEEHGRAWLLHNVEEVSAFEVFLPDFVASMHGRAVRGPVRAVV
jgi:hypothetical protein